MKSYSRQKQQRVVPRRLDRRNAIKNINYDASTSSSSSSFDNQSTHRTRSLDISLADRTSFRIEGIEGEFDLICRSLGLGPDDFSISTADWEARRSNSSPTGGLNFPVDSSRFRELVETDDSSVSDHDHDHDDDEVKIDGECSRPVRNGIVEDRVRVLEGESGIKGLRPPILAPPPSARSRVIVDDLSSNWDLIRSFAPGDTEDLLPDGLDESHETTNVDISGMITSRIDKIVSPSGSRDEDEGVDEDEDEDENNESRVGTIVSPSGSPVELQYSLSPNGSLTVSFKNWQKGDFLGSGSFGTVHEGFNE